MPVIEESRGFPIFNISFAIAKISLRCFVPLLSVDVLIWTLITRLERRSCALLDLALKVLSVDEVRDVILILALALGLLTALHVLVRLGQLPQGGERVGPELVEDARDELCQLLVLTAAIDGKRVCRDGGVDYRTRRGQLQGLTAKELAEENSPLGAEKWMTLPSDLNMLTSSICWIG